MDKYFDETIKKEVIVLSDLKFSAKIFQYNNNYIKFEALNGQKEIDKANELRNNSLEQYYKIDNEKNKELESTFKLENLKIISNTRPEFLRNGNLGIISNNSFKIYDKKMYKLYEIKLEPKSDIISVIELDNHDIIFLSKIKIDKSFGYNYELLIYRLKGKNYFLLQKIKENEKGYILQYGFGGCTRIYLKSYDAKFLKDISRNRFICISNYGFKIYSLNEKNEYSLILLTQHQGDIQIIHEINENKFIFCSLQTGGIFPYYEFLMQIIELKEITDKELYLNNKLEELNKSFSGNENINDIKKVTESLQLTCTHQKILVCKIYHRYNSISNYLILKNKYFIIVVDNNILIIDLNDGKILKRFEILIYENYQNIKLSFNLFYDKTIYIENWDNAEENEFLLCIKGNIILFELIENIKLKIIAQSSFQNIDNLTKINEKFFSFDDENKFICIYENN